MQQLALALTPPNFVCICICAIQVLYSLYTLPKNPDSLEAFYRRFSTPSSAFQAALSFTSTTSSETTKLSI